MQYCTRIIPVHHGVQSGFPFLLGAQVRVYQAATVDEDLEEARECFLEMAVGMNSEDRIVLPKILEWYSSTTLQCYSVQYCTVMATLHP